MERVGDAGGYILLRSAVGVGDGNENDGASGIPHSFFVAMSLFTAMEKIATARVTHRGGYTGALMARIDDSETKKERTFIAKDCSTEKCGDNKP
jgi:hypothetical protein